MNSEKRCSSRSDEEVSDMRNYIIEYRMNWGGKVKEIEILANNKVDAIAIALFEAIPSTEHNHPYSAWVASVTYNNGKHKEFNTFEGKPY
jgi:hypothetical protein